MAGASVFVTASIFCVLAGTLVHLSILDLQLLTMLMPCIDRWRPGPPDRGAYIARALRGGAVYLPVSDVFEHVAAPSSIAGHASHMHVYKRRLVVAATSVAVV